MDCPAKKIARERDAATKAPAILDPASNETFPQVLREKVIINASPADEDGHGAQEASPPC